MVYEEALLVPLIRLGIPITVFKHRDKEEGGPLVEENQGSNINYVHQNTWGKNFFGIFHSKLILLEFDDRVRVVISSSNLYRFDWELMSQVIWFQDFFRKDSNGPRRNQSSEFEDDLKEFVTRLCPKNLKREVFRRTIDLWKYDFSTAIVKLVGSVNGRFTGQELYKYG